MHRGLWGLELGENLEVPIWRIIVLSGPYSGPVFMGTLPLFLDPGWVCRV